MADTNKIEKLTIVIEGEENIKQFSVLLAGGLQAAGMQVLECVASIKSQVKEQMKEKK